ncbi:MAG TPA: glycerophosphodiester phosphodiesterase family protein [Clostridia bacterium]|nr:glycerophosphodiester phosphodiesterase family protein [Clostridia bacterium]
MRRKVAYFILGMGVLFLYLIKPRFKNKKKLRKFLKWNYAHRGLHGGDRAENTLSAFKAAVNNGYAIEMDARSCKDRVVIHHDEDLKRSVGVDMRLDELDFASLGNYYLFGGKETIPSLEEALEVVDSKVPILLEIKSEKNHFKNASDVQAIMDKYEGPYLIESFHPLVLLWYRLHRPEIIRGQLSAGNVEEGFFTSTAMALLLFNIISRPDFIAYEKKGGLSPCLLYLLGTPSFVHTLRSHSERKWYFNVSIFEDYLP